MNHKAFNTNIARDILLKSDEFVILDTETTGLYPCEIVQVGIIDLKGNTLLDSLVKPRCEISEGAIAIHGITSEIVNSAPSFKDIYPQMASILAGKEILVYNAGFDIPVLEHCCNLEGLDYFDAGSFCIMQIYSEWFGQWNDYHKSFTWQRLPGGDHTALGDCLATLEIIRKMAATELTASDLEPIKIDSDIPY